MKIAFRASRWLDTEFAVKGECSSKRKQSLRVGASPCPPPPSPRALLPCFRPGAPCRQRHPFPHRRPRPARLARLAPAARRACRPAPPCRSPRQAAALPCSAPARPVANATHLPTVGPALPPPGPAGTRWPAILLAKPRPRPAPPSLHPAPA